MVGRTPEYLGKKIFRREMTFASLYILATPAVLLVGAAAAIALPGPRETILNTGAHGFSEVLCAHTSAADNNGSWPCCWGGSARSSSCSGWPVRWPPRGRCRPAPAPSRPTSRSS